MSRILESLKQESQKNKEKLLQDLINLHQGFTEYARKQDNPDYMPYLKTVLLNKVLQEWQPFLDLWTLSFIVYADFLKRFPQSVYNSSVQKKLIESIEADIGHIEKISTDKQEEHKKEFKKRLYGFLQRNYPQLIKDSLKTLLTS